MSNLHVETLKLIMSSTIKLDGIRILSQQLIRLIVFQSLKDVIPKKSSIVTFQYGLSDSPTRYGRRGQYSSSILGFGFVTYSPCHVVDSVAESSQLIIHLLVNGFTSNGIIVGRIGISSARRTPTMNMLTLAIYWYHA